MQKKLLFFIISFSLAVSSLLSYSLLYIKFGVDSIGWFIWAGSHYLTFFNLIASLEYLTRKITKKQRIFFLITLILWCIGIFIIGFYISTIKSFCDFNLIVSCVLFACLSLLLFVEGLYCLKFAKIVEDISENPQSGRSMKEDFVSFYAKTLKDENGRIGVKIGFAVLTVLFVYILFLSYVIFANIVCKNVDTVHIVIAVILGVLALTLNQIQIILTSRKIILFTIIENGLLLISLTFYIIIEWVFLPVTFNFILAILCVLLLMPIHLKFGAISKKLAEVYGKN